MRAQLGVSTVKGGRRRQMWEGSGLKYQGAAAGVGAQGGAMPKRWEQRWYPSSEDPAQLTALLPPDPSVPTLRSGSPQPQLLFPQ